RRFETNAGGASARNAAPRCHLRSRHRGVARDARSERRPERDRVRSIHAPARRRNGSTAGDRRETAQRRDRESRNPRDRSIARRRFRYPDGETCGRESAGEGGMKRAPFRGLNAILFKEFITVLRDPMTLFFMLFPPLVEMIAFGYALDNDVKHMATVILDESRTVESRRLVEEFVNTQTFRVVSEVHSVEALAAEIRKGHAY